MDEESISESFDELVRRRRGETTFYERWFAPELKNEIRRVVTSDVEKRVIVSQALNNADRVGARIKRIEIKPLAGDASELIIHIAFI